MLLPQVGLDARMTDVIHEMSRKGLGMTCVVDADGRLAGIITDGDLRRHMSTMPDILQRTARDVMTTRPVTIPGTMLAVEALQILEERKITALIVVDTTIGPPGVLAPARSLAHGDVLKSAVSFMTPEIDGRARALRLLLFDVDGVLTDGRILLHSDGTRVEAVPHP